MRKQRKQWPIKQRRHQDGAIYTQRNILLWKNPLRHKSVSTTKNIIKTIQAISSCGFGECEQRHYKDFCFLDNSIAGNKKIIKKIHLYVTVLGINIPNVEQPLPTHTFGMKRPKSTAFMNCSLLTCVNSFCRTIVWERAIRSWPVLSSRHKHSQKVSLMVKHIPSCIMFLFLQNKHYGEYFSLKCMK